MRCAPPTLRIGQAAEAGYAAWGLALGSAVPSHLLDDGFAQRNDDGSLCRVFDRFAASRKLSIAVLGGSISYGHGVENGADGTWPAKLRHALLSTWGNGSNVRVTNAALPATTAGFAALCVDTLLRRKPDLVFVEYGFNTAETSKLELLVDALRERGAAVVTLDYGHVHNLAAFQ